MALAFLVTTWLLSLRSACGFRAALEPMAPEPLLEKARLYVESMEKRALNALYDYTSVPGMKVPLMSSFLSDLYANVLVPEWRAHGYARDVSASKFAVVIGDLHGQLFNLIAWLQTVKEWQEAKGMSFSVLKGSGLFLCDKRLQYVFLGDYVDRGERGTELAILLLSYKALCPSQIILLQGNHEQAETNGYYGFYQEVSYKLRDARLWQQFNQVFSVLPFVAVAKGKFMATHGGLTPQLSQACRGQRHGGDFHTCITYEIGKGMAWADPNPHGFGYQRSYRGEGIFTHGNDVTGTFLKQNGLKRLLRGHEQEATGHRQMDLGGGYAVHTIFSAADYTGVLCFNPQTNRPAHPPKWDPEMFKAGGEGNGGTIMLVDLKTTGESDGYMTWQLSGSSARKKALNFAGASCDPRLARNQERAEAIRGRLLDGSKEEEAYRRRLERQKTEEEAYRRRLERRLAEEEEAYRRRLERQKAEEEAYRRRLERQKAEEEEAYRRRLERRQAKEPAEEEEEVATTTVVPSPEFASTRTSLPSSPTTSKGKSWKSRMKSYFFGSSLLGKRVLEGNRIPLPENTELPIDCQGHLSSAEKQEHEQFVRATLENASFLEFEGRKIIDLQGEAAVCEDPKKAAEENCAAMAKDLITLQVFAEYSSDGKAGLQRLEEDIVAREGETEPAVER